MSLVAAAFIFGSAISPRSFEIRDITQVEVPRGECRVTAIADDGPLIAQVTWAPCREIDVRVMSAAQLEEAGQLKNLGWLRDSLLREPKQVVLTAWGAHAATAYARGHKSRETTIEIPLAD